METEKLMSEYGRLQLEREAIVARLEQINVLMREKKVEIAKSKKDENNEVPE